MVIDEATEQWMQNNMAQAERARKKQLQDVLTGPLAKRVLKALDAEVEKNGGLPLTDHERADLGARLYPGMSQIEAGRLGGLNSHRALGMRHERPLDDTTALTLVLKVSRRAILRARAERRNGE